MQELERKRKRVLGDKGVWDRYFLRNGMIVGNKGVSRSYFVESDRK
jgi:hypothetical protein